MLVDFESAEHGDIDVAAADDGERHRAVEESGSRKHAARLAAGIDQVGQGVAVKRAHAEKTVLGLQGDLYALGQIVGDQRRQTDAEVDHVAVLHILRDAAGNQILGIHIISPRQG